MISERKVILSSMDNYKGLGSTYRHLFLVIIDDNKCNNNYMVNGG